MACSPAVIVPHRSAATFSRHSRIRAARDPGRG
jgi:hypothetical protein